MKNVHLQPLRVNSQPRLNGHRLPTPAPHGTAVVPGDHSLPGKSLRIVVFGLSITSSWGNGHATTYRALLQEIAKRGHSVLFLERQQECYAANRDLLKPSYCHLGLYTKASEALDRYQAELRSADLIIIGSYVQEGSVIGEWVNRNKQGVAAFYDIDTPVTLAKLRKHDLDYLTRALIPKYDLYLSFTGGPTLDMLETAYGAQMARPLYCSVDTSQYYPETRKIRWDLGYMGTYSEDRQPAVDELLLQVARAWDKAKFVVAGPQYPSEINWPRNVKRYSHLSPDKHRAFYNSQRFTLNVTRGDMVDSGFSPSVRLFEAAACGTPIISDLWPGLEDFFIPGKEILVAHCREESLYYLLDVNETERKLLGSRARARVLSAHTACHRAIELENMVLDLLRPTLSHSPARMPVPTAAHDS